MQLIIRKVYIYIYILSLFPTQTNGNSSLVGFLAVVADRDGTGILSTTCFPFHELIKL